MSPKIQESPSKRLIFMLSVSLSLASVLAIVPLWAGAAETLKAATKPVPTMPMDHSKMGGMKHTDGMSMTGDVDYDFAVNMRTHHQMAVDMSQAQLKNGKSPKLRAMATKIIAAQKKEIAELDQWIKSTKKPLPVSK
jgi:uncharacterized protein (DUF305 family)